MMRINVETISPVHVGVGEERRLTGYDLVKHDGRLIVFDIKAYFSENPEGAEEFYNEAIKLGNEFSLKGFLDEEAIANPAYHKYAIKWSGKLPREVSPVIKTPRNEPYIPGSSIKGAIRTALAYHVLSSASSDTWIKIERGENGTDIRGINSVRNPKWVGKEVEKVLFGCGVMKNNRVFYGDARFDLLKLIHVTDTTPVPGDDGLDLNIVDTMSLQKDGSMKNKGYDISMEVIASGKKMELRIDIDTLFLEKAHEIENQRQWIGLRQKLKAVFGINAGIDSIAEAESKVYDTIRNACNAFTGKIIDKDINILPNNISYVHKVCGRPVGNDFRNRGKKWCNRCQKGNLGHGDIVEVNFDDVEDFYHGLQYDSENDLFLRLGFGVGWHSTTVGLALNDFTCDKVRKNFFIGKFAHFGCDGKVIEERRNKGKGFCLRCKKRGLILGTDVEMIGPLPKTRRFVMKNGRPAYPLGWIKLRIEK